MKKTPIIFLLFVTISIFAQNSAKSTVVFTTSNLPIVLINTAGLAIPDEPKIDATMQIIFNGTGVINNVNDVPNVFNSKIGIELRGSSSINYPQKPFKFETRNALNVKQNVSLLGMPLESDWILLSNYNDKVFIRNTLSYKLFNEMGNYATKTKFCEVVLNGEYIGIYLLMENIKRGANRVNIAKLDPLENSGIEVTGGYIIKNDYWGDNDSWLSNFHPIDHSNLDVHLVYEYPKPKNISPQQKTYIQTFINNFETALYGNSFADLTIGYNKYIDVNSFIDYMVVNELSRNADGFKKSCYFHKDIDTPTAMSKLKAGPIWDFDWAWKNIDECSIFAATNGSGWAYKVNDCEKDVNSTGWFVRLMQDPNFQNKFRCRWNDLRNNVLLTSNLMAYIESSALELNESQKRHYQKWEHLALDSGTSEVEPIQTTFAGHIQQLKNWVNTRLTWLDANIPGDPSVCSTFSNNENDFLKNNISIYPNPVRNVLNIYANNQILVLIDIYDVSGKLIISKNNAKSIDLTNLENGIYFCKINGLNDFSESFKVLVQH